MSGAPGTGSVCVHGHSFWHRAGIAGSLCSLSLRMQITSDHLGSVLGPFSPCEAPRPLPEALGENRPQGNSSLWDGKLIVFSFNQHLHENYL